MREFFRQLFKNVPKEHFTVAMDGFIAVESYESNGLTYEVFKQKDSKLHLIVNVDTLEVIGFKFGRHIM